jgi:hypothetical protein
MREYVKYSLYDRISTRPFLTDIEKRWIAFQVLYALHQCHKVGVSDILLVYLYSTVISHLCFLCLHVVLALLHYLFGARGSVVVEALCCKPEGRGIASR